jgi:hypothetical protein
MYRVAIFVSMVLGIWVSLVICMKQPKPIPRTIDDLHTNQVVYYHSAHGYLNTWQGCGLTIKAIIKGYNDKKEEDSVWDMVCGEFTDCPAPLVHQGIVGSKGELDKDNIPIFGSHDCFSPVVFVTKFRKEWKNEK